MFEFTCRACGIPIAAHVTHVGARASCPTCGTEATIPPVPPPPPPPTPRALSDVSPALTPAPGTGGAEPGPPDLAERAVSALIVGVWLAFCPIVGTLIAGWPGFLYAVVVDLAILTIVIDRHGRGRDWW